MYQITWICCCQILSRGKAHTPFHIRTQKLLLPFQYCLTALYWGFLHWHTPSTNRRLELHLGKLPGFNQNDSHRLRSSSTRKHTHNILDVFTYRQRMKNKLHPVRQLNRMWETIEIPKSLENKEILRRIYFIG